jgi:hypothetical protein
MAPDGSRLLTSGGPSVQTDTEKDRLDDQTDDHARRGEPAHPVAAGQVLDDFGVGGAGSQPAQLAYK